MNVNNKDFENTLNLHQKVLSVYASLELRTKYYTNKLVTSDNYKKSLDNNSNSREKIYISEIPIELDNEISNNDLLGNILKDIIIRYSLMVGFVTESKLLFSYTNSKTSDNKEYKNMNDVIKKEINTINKSGSIIDFSKTFGNTVNPSFAKKMFELFFELYNSDKIYIEDTPTRCCTKCKNVLVNDNVRNIQNYHILFRTQEDPNYILAEYNNLRNTFIVASTLRPWTLVGTDNIAVLSNEEYSVVEIKSIYGVTLHYIIASKYVEDYMASSLIFDYKIKKTIKGNMLKDIVCTSPLDYNKKIKCINTSMNLSSINTAALTITPSHSYLEYTIFMENNLGQVKNYIDTDGKINTSDYEYKFRDYKEVESDIIKKLGKLDLLLFASSEKTNMPKCGNCGNELVYRYLSEWYINENKSNSIQSDIKKVLKKSSIKISMPKRKSKYLKISKNTNRGVPIPVITCALCNKKIISKKVIEIYVEKIEKYGVENVLKMTPEELLEGTIGCDCGGIFFFKNENLFNESFEILSSDIVHNDSNYDKTHNIFIANIDKFTKSLEINRYYDKFNEKMKKIDKFFIYGNIIKNRKILGLPKFYLKEDIKKLDDDKEFIITNVDIEDIINKYGPDILRLWALHNSKIKNILIEENDVKYEERIYFNMRKTLNFIISNILDFDYDKYYVHIENRTDLDKYVYVKMNQLRLKLIKCYDEFDFYKAYVLITEFCLHTLCEEYFNAIKYNLYILNENSNTRRSAQSMLYDIFNMLDIYLQPIIPYLFIETKSHISEFKSLLFEREKVNWTSYDYSEEYSKWQQIFELKSKLNKYIAKAQNEGIIGDTLQASVLVKCKKELYDLINQNNFDILKALNVSEIVAEISGKFLGIVKKSEGDKCERCHNYKNDVGRHTKYRYLCLDCANMLEKE